MTMVEEMIISGFISKIVSDVVDIPENPIKNAIRDADKKRDRNQSIETRIYQVTIDSVNKYTNDKYKGQETLYDAAESIIKGFKSRNKIEAVRMGLKMLASQVTCERCEDFLKILHHEICIDENDILYKEIILLQGEQTFDAVCEGYNVSNRNDEETHEKLDHVIKGINIINEKIDGIEKYETKHYKMPVKNRADEYAYKWDKNVFLNDFNKRDKNAAVNIKLKDLYIEKHLPHYVWKMDGEPLNDLKELLSEYTVDNDDKSMLLILGQPGIGKSTLITWIMANLVKKKDDFLVYQFASDLKDVNWQGDYILSEIFKISNLQYSQLENKVLILDGFDEIQINGDRKRILNKINRELKGWNTLRAFTVIITCRENYIYNLRNIDCDYIVLQAWDETQIDSFCRTYWGKCGNDISEDKIQSILVNKEIFGLPLILYMILALNIALDNSSSIVDVYDQIFSLEKGVIYDRRYDSEHRLNDPKIKEHIYRISQKMAFWMFENNASKAFISQEKFEEICEDEMRKIRRKVVDIQSDTLIGNFFKLKYCEGKGTDELQFVHRSIYEYFVATYFFESLYKLKSNEEVAGELGELLKDGRLTLQILEFIKCKFEGMKGFNIPDTIYEIFNMMLQNGMTYYIETKYNNIIEREMNIFANMLAVVHLWNLTLGEIHERIITYLQYNKHDALDLDGIRLNGKTRKIDLVGIYLEGASLEKASLEGVYLTGADLLLTNLVGANLVEADLTRADLRGVDLTGADLTGVDLSEANLEKAYLVGADLTGAEFKDAKLHATIFDEFQILLLQERYNLNDSRVYVFKTEEIVTYEEYSNMPSE